MFSNDPIRHVSRVICYFCTLSVLECYGWLTSTAVVLDELHLNQINALIILPKEIGAWNNMQIFQMWSLF